jgi:hypothetical protein
MHQIRPVGALNYIYHLDSFHIQSPEKISYRLWMLKTFSRADAKDLGWLGITCQNFTEPLHILVIMLTVLHISRSTLCDDRLGLVSFVYQKLLLDTPPNCMP